MSPKLSLPYTRFLVFALGVMLFTTLPAHSAMSGSDVFVGQRIPSFIVSSGDGRVCDLPSIRGKLTVIFYESRHAIKKNEPFKNSLKAFFREQPEEVRNGVIRLPVIDCSGAFFAVKHFWRKGLMENSRREGLTIYGDWDGKMKKDLGFRDGDSNFVVVDQQGIIRYHLTGKISEDSWDTIKSFLLRLVTGVA
jgi:hypothetical protein